MGSRFCNNEMCGTRNTHEWKMGWPLPIPVGGFANLCHRCGSAYEKSVFCEIFHSEDSGWRECRSCGKQVHCGCIIALELYKVLAFGGICCLSCVKNAGHISSQNDEAPNGYGVLKTSNARGSQSSPIQNRVVGHCADEGRLLQLCKVMEANESTLLPRPRNSERNTSFNRTKQDECPKQIGQTGPSFPCTTQSSVGSLTFSEQDNNISGVDVKNMHESLALPSLNMSLVTPSRTQNLVLPFSGAILDGRDLNKASSCFQQGQRSRPILPKPSKSGLAVGSDTNKGHITQMRIARPPGEGRGKNQLLPRYWPRITDQELEKLSGDLNSTIVPLFEKVLSASDAGRIGRLVLPKACAEAYFPPINQSEGLPLRIGDVKGNEWTLQFRYWPNNNSRMYVLEGVTPCIQAMQLQAGDTVTFSRIDPGGKLVMGFRRASNSEDVQDVQTSALPNGTSSGEASFSGIIENLPAGSSYSSPFITNKVSKESHLNSSSENMYMADADNRLLKNENNGCKTNDDSLQKLVSISEKKRTRNLGSKSKRLLMHSEDVMELRLTWEEAQDLLRPPPSVKPSIVAIEDYEFEEYDEPPVFGKKTIFLTGAFGGQEQWAQCDDCSKWRRLPVEALLPPKWTCSENVWDSSRGSCFVSEELTLKELENLQRGNKDFKKPKTLESQRDTQELEPFGLDALASAAALGDKIGDSGEASTGATTTKHPRHRPGCTCIVCSQPPSGKGKHKPTCMCNVCMTVKRRFKTLMLRKKKRREAETMQKDGIHHKDELEKNGTHTPHVHHLDNGGCQSGSKADVDETSTVQIDLNCHPNREDMQVDSGWNMMSLVEAAGLPLDNYMKQNGMSNLMCGQQASSGSCLLIEVTEESKRHPSDEARLASSMVRQTEKSLVDGVNGESISDRNAHL